MKVTLSVAKISKSFGARKVIRDLSFSVESPGSVGITGHNGSGKTTLMKILCQLLPPTKGEVAIAAEGVKIKSDNYNDYVKMVSPELALYEMLTAYENLRFFGKLAGLKIAREMQDQLLESVGLSGRGDDHVGAYSSGMKQRLKYAVCLMAKPEILLLDEPTANLDDAGKKIVDDIITRQMRERILIIATNETEDLARVERVIRLDN